MIFLILNEIEEHIYENCPRLVQIIPDYTTITPASSTEQIYHENTPSLVQIIPDNTTASPKSPKKQIFQRGVNFFKSFGNKINVIKKKNKNVHQDQLLRIPPRKCESDIQRSELLFKYTINDAMLTLESLPSYKPISAFKAAKIIQGLINDHKVLFDF